MRIRFRNFFACKIADKRTSVKVDVILLPHTIADKFHTLRGEWPQNLAPVLKINDRDILRTGLDVLEQNRQRALRHRAVTHKNDLFIKFQHRASD